MMRDKINTRSMSVAAALLLEGWALLVLGASPQRWRPSLIVKDEVAARILYEAMIRALHDARSLSYTSVCSDGKTEESSSTYRLWLKKPRAFHVEQRNDGSLKSTTFLNDGAHLWIHWNGVRPTLPLDTAQSQEEPRSDAYVQETSSAGQNSIADRTMLFGPAWLRLVLDPSLFYESPDPLEPYIDGIRNRGTNRVGGEVCDVIEIGFQKARRTRYLWLSRQDHLPRRLKEIVRGTDTRVTVEEWSDVTTNGGIPAKILTWSPPKEAQQWNPPRLEDSLLPRGQSAPDFELRSARRGRIRLSDYRGHVVWLYLWDAGSPQCRQEMPGFQSLHQEYKNKGLTILGFNCTDDRRIARAFLREHGVTFPSVLDSSEAAVRLMRSGYGNKTKTLPLNYILDRQGRVVEGWFEPEQDPERVLATLKAAGLELAQ